MRDWESLFSMIGLFKANEALLYHGRRVAGFACAIAERMGYCREGIECIGLAAFLHDIGKTELPAVILNKPSILDKKEMSVVRRHPQYGYGLLQDIRSGSVIADVALQHHERMDGSGYPLGVKGKDIHPVARIIAVADVVEAMVTAQVYRPALTFKDAVREISGKSGLLYDPQVAEISLELIEKNETHL
ncbi:MAG: HD domain-containing phosphohydrolase [Candidatus Omnitrophota bacterium]|jgi:HD-GYP domain-containing protein (c-di-GMP phosphodiesterase class II)